MPKNRLHVENQTYVLFVDIVLSLYQKNLSGMGVTEPDVNFLRSPRIVDKYFRVLIYKNDELVSTYELHAEFEDGGCVDVSSYHAAGESLGDPLEEEGIDVTTESGQDSGVGTAKGFKIEWKLIGKAE